ncbi:hypothetical protein [Paenibacillus periandrae]|uniref:hypothetical protein n=1 Tax=Paenibacillus periandrae TaxID=1761741 RepID=UPI001F099BCD|nr:hypothetical protein [Paenibacillus periandrae]
MTVIGFDPRFVLVPTFRVFLPVQVAPKSSLYTVEPVVPLNKYATISLPFGATHKSWPKDPNEAVVEKTLARVPMLSVRLNTVTPTAFVAIMKYAFPPPNFSRALLILAGGDVGEDPSGNAATLQVAPSSVDFLMIGTEVEVYCEFITHIVPAESRTAESGFKILLTLDVSINTGDAISICFYSPLTNTF